MEYDITEFVFIWVILHQNLYTHDKIKEDGDKSEILIYFKNKKLELGISRLHTLKQLKKDLI